MVDFPDDGGAGYVPTAADTFFARSIVDCVKHGGLWVAPASGAAFRIYHDSATGDGSGRSGRLVYEPGSCCRDDEGEFLARTVAAFGAVGYSVFEDGAALPAAVVGGGASVSG